jgi:hypothetical protein
MSKISDLNPTFAIIWFIFSTILYGIFKYFIGLIDLKEKSPINIDEKYINDESINNYYKSLKYGYLFFIIISSFFINLDLTKQMCGTPQFITTINNTIIPWVLIFTIIIMMIKLFPGWLSPFSNTFGYIVTLVMGIKDVFNDLLDPDPKNSTNSIFIKEALNKIVTDKSIIINEITVENFENFWKNMSHLFRKNIDNISEKKLELFNLVRVKTIVSEVIWYILTGMLIVSISFNNIVGNNCSKNLQDMKKKRIEYEIARDSERKEKEKYSSRYKN